MMRFLSFSVHNLIELLGFRRKKVKRSLNTREAGQSANDTAVFDVETHYVIFLQSSKHLQCISIAYCSSPNSFLRLSCAIRLLSEQV